MTYREKMARYDKYCSKCEHKNVDQAEEPCNTCLDNPVNEDSDIPVNFKEA